MATHSASGSDAALARVADAIDTAGATPKWGWPLRVLWAPGTVSAKIMRAAARQILADGRTAQERLGKLVRFTKITESGAVADFAFVADHDDVRMLRATHGIRVNALVFVGGRRGAWGHDPSSSSWGPRFPTSLPRPIPTKRQAPSR